LAKNTLDKCNQKLAVVIPFFQKEPGILARALESIWRQRIPDGWLVEVIVVDDGSPCPADRETENLPSDGALRLKIIAQKNYGVAAARNRGLDELANDTSVIAFLDSDDIWPDDHLERAIRALNSGFDFFFTDHWRSGHYGSYLRERAAATQRYIEAATKKDSFTVIAPDHFIGLMSQEFPAHVSTVVYRRPIAPDLRFDTRLKAAGEDLLFLCMLLVAAGAVAFDRINSVECGVGLNMYYANRSWDSPKYLEICVDQFLVRKLIDRNIRLTHKSKKLNDKAIKLYRRQLALHTARNLLKYPARVPRPIFDLIKRDAVAAVALPLDVIRGGLTLLQRYTQLLLYPD